VSHHESAGSPCVGCRVDVQDVTVVNVKSPATFEVQDSATKVAVIAAEGSPAIQNGQRVSIIRTMERNGAGGFSNPRVTAESVTNPPGRRVVHLAQRDARPRCATRNASTSNTRGSNSNVPQRWTMLSERDRMSCRPDRDGPVEEGARGREPPKRVLRPPRLRPGSRRARPSRRS